MPENSSRRAWLLAFALICCVIVAGNWPLVTGAAAPQWDGADFFGPHFSLMADTIKAGRLVLWDPWVAGGNPDFAEPEFGGTSPLLLLMGLLSPSPQAGFVMYWISLWLIGGLGMMFLTRHLGSPVWGSAVIALGFVSSGIYTGHAEHTSTIASVSFLPFILWRFDAALQHRKLWFAVQAGLFYGLSALGGYPEYTILTPLFLGLWLVCHLVARSGSRPTLAMAMLLITVMVGSVICSPSYVGFLKSTHGYSDRVGPRSRQESVGSNIMPVGAISTLASPYLPLLESPPNPIWPVSDISMVSIYMGTGILTLALWSWWRSTRWQWSLAGVALFFICCALGNQIPVRGWLYDLLLPTRYFRNAAMFRAYAMVVMACFAAYGARDLATQPDTKKQRRFFVIGSALLAVAACVTFAVVGHAAHKRAEGMFWSHWSIRSAGRLQVYVLWIGIVVLAFLFKRNMISGHALSRCFLVIALVDSLATLRISQPVMYSASLLPVWRAMNTEHRGSLNLGVAGLKRELDGPPEVGQPPNNRNIPLRAPTFENYVTFVNRFHQQMLAIPAMRNIALSENRMWFSASPTWLPPSNASFDLFRQKFASSTVPAIILHATDQMLAMSPNDSSTPYPANAVSTLADSTPAAISQVFYRPNALAFSYRAPRAGWLMVTDRWASDWTATVNGLPQRILGADFIFRAVPVTAGDNSIIFHYRPPFFIPLLVLSWTLLLVGTVVESMRFLKLSGH